MANERKKPVLIDVGARYGMRDTPWAELMDNGDLRCYLIEPDPLECERLQREHPRASVKQVAFGSVTGKQKFFRTRHPVCASLREPNWDLLQRYEARSWFEVVDTGEVYVQRMDELIMKGELEPPDFLHVDVQGFELEVLIGAGEFLQHATGLKLELHPIPMYQGEQTLFEVGTWLAERDFHLISVQQQGPYEGDYVEAICYFLNRSRPQGDEWLADWFIKWHGLATVGERERHIAHVRQCLRELDIEHR